MSIILCIQLQPFSTLYSLLKEGKLELADAVISSKFIVLQIFFVDEKRGSEYSDGVTSAKHLITVCASNADFAITQEHEDITSNSFRADSLPPSVKNCLAKQ